MAEYLLTHLFIARVYSFPGWEKVKGRVYGVDTYVVTQKDKAGDLVPRFGDSALTMWMTDKCSMSEHVQQLTKLQKAQAGYVSTL